MSEQCWCYLMQTQVNVEGKIVGHRQADLLEITGCAFEVDHKTCPHRQSRGCLIGKTVEGSWGVVNHY